MCSPQPQETSRDSRALDRTWGVSRGNNAQRGVSRNVATSTPGLGSRTTGCRASEFTSAQTARRVCHGPGPALRHYTAESTPPIRRIITLLGHRHPKPGSHARDSRARSPGTGEPYCRGPALPICALARSLRTARARWRAVDSSRASVARVLDGSGGGGRPPDRISCPVIFSNLSV